MKRPWFTALLLLLGFVTQPVSAVHVNNLYKSPLLVASQDVALRNKVILQTFAQVFVKKIQGGSL